MRSVQFRMSRVLATRVFCLEKFGAVNRRYNEWTCAYISALSVILQTTSPGC